MPLSQFTIYSSSDPFGPGPLTGTTGSLIPVLDACLVNGYGTGQYAKPAAGWRKPLGNVSASCVSAYQQISGSGMTLFINDNAVTGLGARVAMATGWVSASALVGNATNANNVGAGWGQFPLPWQALTTGCISWFKSATNDTTQRSWIIAADAYTMYIWFADGQSSGFYYHGGFGDFYSQYGVSDLGRCLLFGKYTNTTNNIANFEMSDLITGGLTGGNSGTSNLFSYMPGHYVARGPGGNGASMRFCKKGDWAVAVNNINGGNEAALCATMTGCLPCPNPTDNSYYLSPIWVVDPAAVGLRGRYRGIWQVCHAVNNFTNGQIIKGSGANAGKTFMIVTEGYNGGFWAVETSPTVWTN